MHLLPCGIGIHLLRSSRAISAILLISTLLLVLMPLAQAAGSRLLYSNGLTGYRGNLEWRTNTYGAGLLLRRTLIHAFTQAGEFINVGSSAVGVGNGDILIYNPGQISGPVGNESLPALTPGVNGFRCSAQRTATGNANLGRITSRAQELAGPDTISIPASGTVGGGVAGGYAPCFYQAPATGIYNVIFFGPTGDGSTANGAPTGLVDIGDIFTQPNNYNATQGTSVTAWDVTVRASLAAVTDLGGRVFTNYIAQYAGGNNRPIDAIIYAVTNDGYHYQIDLRGVDPNGFAFYGNQVGFLDSNGQTPLYHDVLGNNGQLDVLQGGVSLAPPTFPIFFDPILDSATLTALGIPLTPVMPSLNSLSFAGSAGGSASLLGTGGTFSFVSNSAAVYEIVISRDGINFDPTLPQNRILRGVQSVGAQSVSWNGLDNSGAPFPVGTGYQVRAVIHGGEYHFP